MTGGLQRGKAILGIGLFALLALAAVGAVSASADVQPSEVAEYRQDFEVPGQEAEESLEVQQRGAEADISGNLEERLGSQYAGVWFDNEKGEFVVPLLPGVSGTAISSEFTQTDLGADEFRTSQAQSSWEELEVAQDEIDQALLQPMEEGIVETSLDPRANTVVILQAAGADGEVRGEIQRLAANALVKVNIQTSAAESLEGQLEACSDPFCGSPLRGGVKIFNSLSPEELCTAGFPAIGNNGTRYLVTAGHCVQLYPGAPLNLNWSSKDSGLQTHSIGAVEQWEHDDGAIIKATGSWWDTGSWPAEIAYWGTPIIGKKGIEGKTTPVDLDYPITGEATSVVGDYACHSGIMTGTTCGFITKVNITHSFAGIPHPGLNELDGACASPGDSGGPYFIGHTALGLHVGSENGEICGDPLYYSDIVKATNALGVSVAPRAPRVTIQTTPLNGSPGWVTIKGQVTAPNTTISNKVVNIKLSRWSVANNNWELKATLQANVNNNSYEINNWNGVSPGGWMAKTVFPAQAPFGEAASEEVKEGHFEVKAGYRIVNKKSGKCLDVTNRSFDNTAPMQQWECLDPMTAQGQVFTLVPQGEYIQLVARNSGRCVDVPGASQADGIGLQQYSCLGAGQTNQLWKGVPVETVGGVEYVELRAKHSSKCMDVVNGSTANGAGVQQWSCNGFGQQKWFFQSVDSNPIQTETTAQVPAGSTLNGQPGYVSVNGVVKSNAYPLAGKYVNVNFSREESPGNWTVKSTAHPTLDAAGNYEVSNWGVSVGNWRVRTTFPNGEGFGESSSEYRNFQIKSGYRFVYRHSSKCMTLSGNSATNGTPIVQRACNANPTGGDGQVFTLVPMGGGYVNLKINSTEKCVDVTGASTANGAGLQEYTCLGPNQANQLWQPIAISGQPGWNAFIAKHSGKCADVPGSSTADGVGFIQYECLWTGNQQFAYQAIN